MNRVKEYSLSFVVNCNRNRSVVILPRDKVENLASNDRAFLELGVLAHMVESKNIFGAKVLRTDAVEDVRHQVAEITNAKGIFVGAGSAAYVNVLFAENATVHALGPERVMAFTNTFPLFHEIWDLASKRNNLILLEEKLDERSLRALTPHKMFITKKYT